MSKHAQRRSSRRKILWLRNAPHSHSTFTRSTRNRYYTFYWAIITLATIIAYSITQNQQLLAMESLIYTALTTVLAYHFKRDH